MPSTAENSTPVVPCARLLRGIDAGLWRRSFARKVNFISLSGSVAGKRQYTIGYWSASCVIIVSYGQEVFVRYEQNCAVHCESIDVILTQSLTDRMHIVNKKN